MPGMWGATQALAAVADRLEAAFDGDPAPREVRCRPGVGRVGAAAWRGGALGEAADGSLWCVDGEACAYAEGPPAAGEGVEGGNAAWLHADGRVTLRADDAGAFPLYFAARGGGLAFSSRLRPLARALDARPDPVGVAEFLRFAYTLAGRTLFEGVRRLQPGQLLRWRAGGDPVLEERARTWVGVAADLSTPEAAAEAVAPALRAAVASALPAGAPPVLMMSAGWDSRTLLALAAGAAEGLTAFSHGDPASRELALTRALCARAGVPLRVRPIGPDVWDPEHLERTFAATECLVFPHWAWAGRAGPEGACLASGILGEVLGGHYGATQVQAGRGKAVALVRAMRAGTDEPEGADPVAAVYDRLRIRELDRPWYLRRASEADHARVRDGINEDIDHDLRRLAARGVATSWQLLEAFVTEHRGAQYIAGQARSARLAADVALPFARGALLALASSIPAPVKVHNRVNRALARALAPALARLPTAATLVPASWPLLLQEGSRAARRGWEAARWRLHGATRGRVGRPRLGWADLEFLRDGTLLRARAGDLRADLWDRGAFERFAEDLRTYGWRGSLHPVFDQMGKIMTVDRWLR